MICVGLSLGRRLRAHENSTVVERRRERRAGTAPTGQSWDFHSSEVRISAVGHILQDLLHLE